MENVCFCLFDGYICVRRIWVVLNFGPIKGDGKQRPEADFITPSLGKRVEARSRLPNLWGKTWHSPEEGCSHDV